MEPLELSIHLAETVVPAVDLLDVAPDAAGVVVEVAAEATNKKMEPAVAGSISIIGF